MDYPRSRAAALLLHGGKFTDGNPATGIPASYDPADIYDDIIDSILAVQAAGDIVADEGDSSQLQAAIANQIRQASGSVQDWERINDADYEVVPGDFNKYIVLDTGATADRTFTINDGTQGGDRLFFSTLTPGINLKFRIKPGSTAKFFGIDPIFFGGVTNFQIAYGEELTIVWNGLFWHVQSYSGSFLKTYSNGTDLRSLSSFLTTLTFGSANGVLKLPNFQNLNNPIILQWGTGTLPNSGSRTASVSIAFRQAFPNLVSHVVAIANGSTGVGGYAPSMSSGSFTLSGCSITGDLLGSGAFNSTVPFTWFAIGG